MSPKKKKRPQAAQALIDELLDDKSGGQSSGSNGEPLLLSVDESPQNANVVPSESDFDSANFRLVDTGVTPGLSLDTSQPHELDPVAAAGKTAIANRNSSVAEKTAMANATRTQMSPDRKRISLEAPKEEKRPPAPAPFDGTKPVLTQKADREESVSELPDLSLDVGADFGGDETMRIKTPPPGPALDATLRASRDIRQSKPAKPTPELSKTFDRGGATEVYGSVKPSGQQTNAISAASAVFASSEAALKQSESLRIAQSRISDLERELERIRRENEDLASAGETLRRRTDELISKAESLEIKERESSRIHEEERKVLRGQMQAKDRENSELRSRVEEIEQRLESNFKKIRVRERELEHRLEIVKMESLTLVSTKDKMILELKRELDQMLQENEFAKAKTQEMFGQYKDKQETIRRVVRALRIALTILEGDDETVVPLKKAE